MYKCIIKESNMSPSVMIASGRSRVVRVSREVVKTIPPIEGKK